MMGIARQIHLLSLILLTLNASAQTDLNDRRASQNANSSIHAGETAVGRILEADAMNYISGWYYVPENSFFLDHKWIKTNYGNWIEFKGDGTWREIVDNWGMRLERTGIWSYESGQFIQHLQSGKRLNYSYIDNTLVVQNYEEERSRACFQPAPTAPSVLLDLPSIPCTLEKAVGYLQSKLSENQKTCLRQFSETEVKEMDPTLVCLQLGLDEGNTKLLEACGTDYPLTAARTIQLALLKSLREDSLDCAAYEKLEQAVNIPIQTFEAEGMSLGEFVGQLNVRMKEALRKAGGSDDTCLILANPDSTRRMIPFLWGEPRLPVWGLDHSKDIRYTTIADICSMEPYLVLDGSGPHRINLLPPSTIELLLHGCDDKQKQHASARMEPVKWGHDTIEASLFSTKSMRMEYIAGPGKTSRWLMNGKNPPMPINEVAKFALEKMNGSESYIIDHIRISNNSDLEFVHYDNTRPNRWRWPEGRYIWSYEVGCIIPTWCYRPEELKIDHAFAQRHVKWTFDYTQTVFAPGCEWTDYSRIPPLSPEGAIGKLRHFLKTTWDINVSFEDVSITLQRIARSNYWYYAIRTYGFAGGEQNAAIGYVLLDGTVIPIKNMTRVASEYDGEGWLLPTSP